MQNRLWSIGLVVALSAANCIAPPTSGQKLNDAAQEANLAARFGRMDVALGHATPEFAPDFAKRRAAWGNEIRVVDVGVTGVKRTEEERAEVAVTYAWTRMSEGTLHTTHALQYWTRESGDWLIEREKREAGDVGLFGEKIPEQVHAAPRPDVHFAVKTIREADH